MNQDFFKAQMKKLSVAYDKQLETERLQEYWRFLKDTDSAAFEKTIDHIIVHSDRFPTIAAINELKKQFRNDSTFKPSTLSNNERATGDEIKYFFRVVDMISTMHEKHLTFNGERLQDTRQACAPLTFEEWDAAGRPQTWSPVYDMFLEGAIRPYKRSIAGEDSLAKYCKEFSEMLYQIIQEAGVRHTPRLEVISKVA